MKIEKPTIQGLKPFASGEATGSWTWADSGAQWADSDYMWAAQLETGEIPRIGDIKLSKAELKGGIKLSKAELK